MTLVSAANEAEVSVLVPAKDEADNLPQFVREFKDDLETTPFAAELIVVDDGSTDATSKVLAELSRDHRFLRVVTHRRQRGIAEALKTAGERASGDIFVFYPADGQFLTSEISSLVEPILRGEADVVTGTKQGRYEKAVVSGVYNLLCRWLFGIRVTDLNAVKAYRRQVMDTLPDRPDWHRFMVVFAAAEGFTIDERPVTLRPRRAGRSKFGLGRIPVGITDLMSVWFQLRFGRKPMLFFGVSGGVLFLFGFVVGIIALVLRFGYGLGFRPLLDLVALLVITGIALFGFGFLGELLAAQKEEIRGLRRDLNRLLSNQRHSDGT